MKTIKFIVTIVLLASIFVAFLVQLFASYLARGKNGVNESRKNKIKLIAFVYMAAATVAVIILALI